MADEPDPGVADPPLDRPSLARDLGEWGGGSPVRWGLVVVAVIAVTVATFLLLTQSRFMLPVLYAIF